MSESAEGNPIPREVITHLSTVAERGRVLPTDAHHGGIHGTSIEAIKYVIDNGVLPGRIAHDRRMHYEPGDISFYPTRELAELAKQHHVYVPPDSDRQLEDVVDYARLITEEHGLLTKLGYNIGNPEATDAVRSLVLDDIRTYFLDQGKTQEEIDDAIQAVSPLRGFLIGFSPEIQSTPGITFTHGDADGREGDLNMRTNGRGLPYRYISGIEPLGPVEKAYLEGLTIR